VQIATGDGHEPFVQVCKSVSRAVHKIDLMSPMLDRNRGLARLAWSRQEGVAQTRLSTSE